MKSALTGWHKPFVIPKSIPAQEQVEYCVGVIERYRAELVVLRRDSRQLVSCKKKIEKQEKKIKDMEEFIRQRDLLIEEMERSHEEFEELIKKYKRQRDLYRGMVFKPNKKKRKSSSKTSKRGGRVGHKGHGRAKKEADVIKRVYATNCPDCHGRINRVKGYTSHTVEDIPELLKLHTIVTEYRIERQWCGDCQKEVRAVAPGVIPHSRLGINLLVTGVLMRYGIPASFNKIVFTFKNLFGIKVSEGGLVDLLARTKEYLGPFYEQIIREVKKARVKHADETGWRIEGVNNWIWEFLAQQSVYYKIEETRKKEIPKRELGDCHEEDVLVRDDYRAYQELELKHQSCWVHLLRASKKAAAAEDASEEVARLHKQLKQMYKELSEIIKTRFDRQKREKTYQQKWGELRTIIEGEYQEEDTRAVQTRIANQGENLLTALLYEDVPLTNNKAEREIRAMVVSRKMSGGSKTRKGADTHAVNMSVFQTLKLREEPLALALQEKILAGATGKN